jgi:hypothetical protein
MFTVFWFNKQNEFETCTTSPLVSLSPVSRSAGKPLPIQNGSGGSEHLDPTFFFANPDPIPDPGFMTKNLKKNLLLEICL